MSDIASSDLSPRIQPPAAEMPPLLEHAPLPPAPPAKTAAQSRLEVRVWSALVFLGCAAMYGVALHLTPSSDGTGTHQQLGLLPCGMLAATGCPCPTCGCTTAVCYFVHGNPIASLATQPFGFAVALVAAIALPLTLIAIVTGKWKGPSMFWLSYHWQYWTYGTVAVLMAGWIYKIIAMHSHLFEGGMPTLW